MNHPNRPTIPPPGADLRRDSFEQERREVLDTVFEALCRHPPDPDEMAACAYLMRHLSGGYDRDAA